MISEQKTGFLGKGELADALSLGVHHVQLMPILSQLLHQFFKALRAHGNPALHGFHLFLAHAGRGIQRPHHLGQQCLLMKPANIPHLCRHKGNGAGIVLSAFQHQMHYRIVSVRLGHKDRIHQRMRQNLAMGIPAHIGEQGLAVGGGRAGTEDKGTHGQWLRKMWKYCTSQEALT